MHTQTPNIKVLREKHQIRNVCGRTTTTTKQRQHNFSIGQFIAIGREVMVSKRWKLKENTTSRCAKMIHLKIAFQTFGIARSMCFFLLHLQTFPVIWVGLSGLWN